MFEQAQQEAQHALIEHFRNEINGFHSITHSLPEIFMRRPFPASFNQANHYTAPNATTTATNTPQLEGSFAHKSISLQLMSAATDLSWVKVLSRGLSKKVINAQPQRAKDDAYKLIPEVLYEHEDLKAEVLTRKATAILQQALTPGSVLFTFPNKTFDHRTAAYRVIQEQISVNVQFRPLSLYHQKLNGDLLVEAKFDTFDDTKRAIHTGITYREVVYKATAAKDNSEGKLTHVQMTMVRMPNMSTLLEDLLRSLKYSGKVYQVKKYTIDGYFEGHHVSFMIDTAVKYTDAEGKAYEVQPLSRMLYLSAWDVYVPAMYKGAPPVCHFCRQSGHIRAACPTLAKRKCFKCHNLGHTARFCREEEKSFNEALEDYDARKTSQAATEPRAAHTHDNDNDPVPGESPTIQDILEQQQQLHAANTAAVAAKSTSSSKISTFSLDDEDNTSLGQSSEEMEVDPEALVRTANGSLASKHAPSSVSLFMQVDPQKPNATVSPGVSPLPVSFKTSTVPQRRHSTSSTSMSEAPMYQDAHRA
ncbi:hypothetical protein PS15m_010229 [Mucor circinelloides]